MEILQMKYGLQIFAALESNGTTRERFGKDVSAFVTVSSKRLSTNSVSFQRKNEFESAVDTVYWF